MRTIIDNIIKAFGHSQFSLSDAYVVNEEYNKESVRARIYENIGIVFEKRERGVYQTTDNSCLLIEGDGRNLDFCADASIDCIITDHPWEDKRSTKGGNRNFANYKTFKYSQEDFLEKARVLKTGAFLCEIVPTESATNYEYLYSIKQMAKAAGFEYYAQVPWKKGTFVSNTGRTAKNTETVLLFTKGKARALRPDKQRGLDVDGNPTKYMSGAAGMLPTCFNIQPVPHNKQIAQSEKPVALYEQILEFITLPGEIVLDQFAGSGAVGQACINRNRCCIMIEICEEVCAKIVNRLNMSSISQSTYSVIVH